MGIDAHMMTLAFLSYDMSKHHISKENKIDALTMEHLFGPLIIILVGLTLSILSFAVEMRSLMGQQITKIQNT